MRIGEVAEQAGVNVETLRYYERRGLLPEPVRSTGGHRDYGEESVRFVRAVKEAQSLGFSLAEIEEYLRLTRRNPARASPEIRARLAEKVGEVDVKLAGLQTMRTGLLRALEADLDSVAKSTSSAGYLVRGGHDPELPAGEALHVTNGESTANTLGRTSLGGTVLPWQDVLHEGPLADVPAAEFRTLRAGFLAEHGWGEESALHAGLQQRDGLLERAVSEGHPIVLWFEHDLYDQLQLLQVLAALGASAPGQVELVPADEYLGSLNAERLERWWGMRNSVSAEMLELGRTAWQAVCADEVDAFLERDTRALPHLAAALQRLLEERAPLSRTKRQLLSALADGRRRPVELFLANQAAEEAIFLGDAWCFLHLYELAEDGLLAPVGGALPLPPPHGDHDAFAAVELELTPAGLAKLGR